MKGKPAVPKLMRVGVLMGGPSSEHEVSLATGQNVLEGLDRSKYEPLAVKILKAGQWFLNGKPTTADKVFQACDVVFNALHGYYGEDGKLQALLDHNKVRYTGSGVAASAIAMDKFHSRELFKLAGFNVPKTLKLLKGENYSARLQFFINKITKLPVVVKPCSNGSSVGVTIVEEASGLNKAITAAFKLDREVLVEE
ncbi:MAG: D-alanine--D-alanine ligase A, partial [Candidatus Uhrbacteria bacterium]|nr:D-alanine--D-alanine ligase A [Candidatus Uhrbacteria bacterium]